jgi:hypothetical protein
VGCPDFADADVGGTSNVRSVADAAPTEPIKDSSKLDRISQFDMFILLELQINGG